MLAVTEKPPSAEGLGSFLLLYSLIFPLQNFQTAIDVQLTIESLHPTRNSACSNTWPWGYHIGCSVCSVAFCDLYYRMCLFTYYSMHHSNCWRLQVKAMHPTATGAKRQRLIDQAVEAITAEQARPNSRPNGRRAPAAGNPPDPCVGSPADDTLTATDAGGSAVPSKDTPEVMERRGLSPRHGHRRRRRVTIEQDGSGGGGGEECHVDWPAVSGPSGSGPGGRQRACGQLVSHSDDAGLRRRGATAELGGVVRGADRAGPSGSAPAAAPPAWRLQALIPLQMDAGSSAAGAQAPDASAPTARSVPVRQLDSSIALPRRAGCVGQQGVGYAAAGGRNAARVEVGPMQPSSSDGGVRAAHMHAVEAVQLSTRRGEGGACGHTQQQPQRRGDALTGACAAPAPREAVAPGDALAVHTPCGADASSSGGAEPLCVVQVRVSDSLDAGCVMHGAAMATGGGTSAAPTESTHENAGPGTARPPHDGNAGASFDSQFEDAEASAASAAPPPEASVAASAAAPVVCDAAHDVSASAARECGICGSSEVPTAGAGGGESSQHCQRCDLMLSMLARDAVTPARLRAAFAELRSRGLGEDGVAVMHAALHGAGAPAAGDAELEPQRAAGGERAGRGAGHGGAAECAAEPEAGAAAVVVHEPVPELGEGDRAQGIDAGVAGDGCDDAAAPAGSDPHDAMGVPASAPAPECGAGAVGAAAALCSAHDRVGKSVEGTAPMHGRDEAPPGLPARPRCGICEEQMPDGELSGAGSSEMCGQCRRVLRLCTGVCIAQPAESMRATRGILSAHGRPSGLSDVQVLRAVQAHAEWGEAAAVPAAGRSRTGDSARHALAHHVCSAAAAAADGGARGGSARAACDSPAREHAGAVPHARAMQAEPAAERSCREGVAGGMPPAAGMSAPGDMRDEEELDSCALRDTGAEHDDADDDGDGVTAVPPAKRLCLRTGAASAKGCRVCLVKPCVYKRSYCRRCNSMSVKVKGPGGVAFLRQAVRELGPDTETSAVLARAQKLRECDAVATADRVHPDAVHGGTGEAGPSTAGGGSRAGAQADSFVEDEHSNGGESERVDDDSNSSAASVSDGEADGGVIAAAPCATLQQPPIGTGPASMCHLCLVSPRHLSSVYCKRCDTVRGKVKGPGAVFFLRQAIRALGANATESALVVETRMLRKRGAAAAAAAGLLPGTRAAAARRRTHGRHRRSAPGGAAGTIIKRGSGTSAAHGQAEAGARDYWRAFLPHSTLAALHSRIPELVPVRPLPKGNACTACMHDASINLQRQQRMPHRLSQCLRTRVARNLPRPCECGADCVHACRAKVTCTARTSRQGQRPFRFRR